MTGLADRGLKVLFIENTGIRNPRFSDLSRLYLRLKTASGTVKITNEIPENMEILSPLAVPLPYTHAAVLYNAKYLKKHIDNFLEKNNLFPGEVLFWTCLATPAVLRLAESCPWGCLVYDLVSDPKLVEARVGPYEKRILSRADIVLFASYTLYEQYCPDTRNPVVFKDGFNIELLDIEPGPCMMDNLPGPRFLYIGGINRKIWPEMLESLGRSFPGGSIVLMGPKTDDAAIPDLPNIHILPARGHYAELAPFLARADAGIIPYRNDHYSGVMHPAKLNEYLIFGLPVVATATPELEKLSQQWGEVFLYFGEDPEDFARAAFRAMAEDNEEKRNARKSFTRSNTWNYRVDELSRILDKIN
ncbi:MAG: glycosyltransferase [Peptococcaceae bacterium]|nr:glycosyltransferase [Peptococcaceae bacterium]